MCLSLFSFRGGDSMSGNFVGGTFRGENFAVKKGGALLPNQIEGAL